MRYQDDLAGLRQFLKFLRSPGAVLKRGGVDVTRKEARILAREIAHLEETLARVKGVPDA